MASTVYDRWDTGTWLLELQGEPLELLYVASLISENKTLELVEVECRFYLTSSRFSSCQDAQTVRALGRELVEALSGALSLENLRYGIQILGLCKTKLGDHPSPMVCLESRSSTTKIGMPSVTITGGSPASPDPRAVNLSKYLSQAVDSYNARYALRLVSAEHPTWMDLYKAFELVRKGVRQSEEKMVGKKVNGKKALERWTTVDEQNLFTRTANSFEAIGEDARHSTQEETPPKDPMTLNDAVVYVRGLVAKWLQSKSV